MCSITYYRHVQANPDHNKNHEKKWKLKRKAKRPAMSITGTGCGNPFVTLGPPGMEVSPALGDDDKELTLSQGQRQKKKSEA